MTDESGPAPLPPLYEPTAPPAVALPITSMTPPAEPASPPAVAGPADAGETPPRRRPGWSSQGLPVVTDTVNFWTINEAAGILGPPSIDAGTLRNLVRVLGLEPAGKRRTTVAGISGRHARVYKASDLIAAHDRVTKIANGG